MPVKQTPHFSEAELRCHCGCNMALMDETFMARIEELREKYGRPMHVSSAYRCPDYDQEIGGKGVHPSGTAIDILCSSKDYRDMLKLATAMDFGGIGIHQRGPMATRFMHLDDMLSIVHPRPTGWSY